MVHKSGSETQHSPQICQTHTEWFQRNNHRCWKRMGTAQRHKLALSVRKFWSWRVKDFRIRPSSCWASTARLRNSNISMAVSDLIYIQQMLNCKHCLIQENMISNICSSETLKTYGHHICCSISRLWIKRASEISMGWNKSSKVLKYKIQLSLLPVNLSIAHSRPYTPKTK